LKADFTRTVTEKPIYGGQFIDENLLKQNINNFFTDDKHINPWGIWHIYTWQKWANKYDLK
jgi:asparagine synthase (glutamine-hydrolysing)